MVTCLCLRGDSTPSNTIHPKIKADISKSEIVSVVFGLFCVISDAFTLCLRYFLHTMGSMLFLTPIHTPIQPSPYSSMNVMYYGSPGISYVIFVDSAAASFISCHIQSTYFLTAVNVSGLPMTVPLPVLNLLLWVSPLPLVCQ